MKILVTGISGFLGGELLRLMGNDEHQYYCLIRRQSLPKLMSKVAPYKNIIPVVGDLTTQNLLEIEKGQVDLHQIKSELDAILHAGALYDLKSSKEDCYMQNIIGTQNVINFARHCPNLTSFHYVSTIAVAGTAKGLFKEDELSLGQQFTDFYSESKYKAEMMVRNLNLENVKMSIYRPGIIIANSRDFEVQNINGPYYLFNLLKKVKSCQNLINKLPIMLLPYLKEASFPLIPVDDVAKVIYQNLLDTKEQSSLQTFQLVAKNNPTVGEFLQKTLLAYKFHGKLKALKQSRLNPYLLKALQMPKELLNYMYAEVSFDTKNAVEKFGGEIQDFEAYEKDFYTKSINL